jgi:hypothetical protein
MRLADRIAQCRAPFIVENTRDGSVTHLNGAKEFAESIGQCATRYRPLILERLNRARAKAGKARLLDQIEVLSPLLPEYQPCNLNSPHSGRRASRLHHVRGHLVRRGSRIFWRVPHLRGSARNGIIRSRMVTWTVDAAQQVARDTCALLTPDDARCARTSLMGGGASAKIQPHHARQRQAQQNLTKTLPRSASTSPVEG